jgi:hypothetical protein
MNLAVELLLTSLGTIAGIVLVSIVIEKIIQRMRA